MTPLDLENGEEPDEPKTAKRGPGRPRKTETSADLERDIREQLEELAAWFGTRDPELADTFGGDVAKMAKFLAARAGKSERFTTVLRVVFAKDGPLAGLRAFGRTARTVLARVNARRAEAADPDLYVDEDGNTRDRNGNVVVPGA